MLLKYSQYQKRSRVLTNGPQRSTGGMKMLNGKGKGYRKGVKCAASKRIHPRNIALRKEEEEPMIVDPCDNSNDSGLGIERIDISNRRSQYIDQEYCWNEEVSNKRPYDIIKHESDNANDNFTFLPKVGQRQPATELPLCLLGKGGGAVARGGGKTTTSQGVSRNGKVQLEIISQPEMQHRARYQTEGSRGAVKDRTGNSFPIVRLSGYKKPATLEVYIGTDQGRVAPHMFYQACRVSGKNSTPCIEKKVDGTVLIEIEMDPAKEMTVTCDCVGILKERNVDVEHRFPEESSGRSKKKSTRCRMVFRTNIAHEDGTLETLQVTSQPIICTQPPGIPEICKKSLTSCPVSGGQELFILGKNFLKDTKVLFSYGDSGTDMRWEAFVQPDKEFLQQSHLVCIVPPFRDEGIREAVAVQLVVMSSGRSSEPHSFFYTPLNAFTMDSTAAKRSSANNVIGSSMFSGQNVLLGVQWHVPMQTEPFIPEKSPKLEEKAESAMMPPPTMPPPVRRNEVKREAESPTSCLPPGFQEFVSTAEAPLPSLSVENYLSRIESPPQAHHSSKATELIPLPLGQLELPTQPPLNSPGQVIMPTKIPGLLVETSDPLLTGTGLIFSATEGVPTAVAPPALLENPISGQDFVSVQSNPIQADSGFRVDGEVVPGVVFSPERLSAPSSQHTSPMSLPPSSPLSQTTSSPLSISSSSLALSSSSPLSITTSNPVSLAPNQAFPGLLPESALQAFSPTKDAKPADLIPSIPKEVSSIPEVSKPVHPIPQKKCEEGIPLPQELTQMSEHDLLSYINPSCFDQGNPSTFPQFFI